MKLYLCYLVFFLLINVIIIVGSRFSDQTHYNEFVESGFKSWVLMRRRLVLEVKNTQNRAAQRPKEKGPFSRGQESPTPLAPQKSLSFFWVSFFFLAIPPPSNCSAAVKFACWHWYCLSFFSLWDLCCYISFSSIHPPPTLVNHSRLFSSARPIDHSFWRSVSCCGPISLSRSHIHINGVRVLVAGI